VNQLLVKTLCGGALLLTVGCGAAPQVFPAPPEAVQQHFAFTAVVEPVAGRFQIVAQPQPVFGVIPQDANGNPATADSGKVQLYGATVSFASGGVGYPSGCLTTSPEVMFSDVELLTGFKEQLRNVYVKIVSVSGGQTFCGPKPTDASHPAALNPNIWTYAYGPLDVGQDGFSQSKRSLKWGLQLPDNGAFWFQGEVWADVVPALPTNLSPADGTVLRTGDPTAEAAFVWREDATANGSRPTAGQAPLPTGAGTQVTITRCNTLASGAFDAAACTLVVSPTPVVTRSLAYTIKVPTGYWYQWSLRPAFYLPGQPTTLTVGSQVVSRSFRAGS
jgi:hypothetical protein